MPRTTRSSTRATATDTLDESQRLLPGQAQQAPIDPPPKRRGRPPKPKLPTAASNDLSSAGTQPDDSVTPSRSLAVTPKPRGRPRKAGVTATMGEAPEVVTPGISPEAPLSAIPAPVVSRPKPRPINRSVTQPMSGPTLPIDIPGDGNAHKRDRASITEGAELDFEDAETGADNGTAAKKKKIDFSEADQVTKPKPVRIIPPRSPLPQRINRVRNPGKPDEPRAKRTSDEVAAELAMKEKLLREIEELKAQRLQMVAEREIEIELAAEKARQTTVMYLTDLNDVEHSADRTATDLEDEMDVDGDEMTMDVDLDLENEDRVQDLKGKKPALSKGAPAKRKPKKTARGETRAAIDAVRTKIVEEKRKIASTSSTSTTPAKKSKPAYPSGLVTNWESKVPSNSLRSKKALGERASGSSVAPHTSSPGPSDSLAIGGLSNLDIEEGPPQVTSSPRIRSTNCRREVVEIVDDEPRNSEVSGLPTPSRSARPPAKPTKTAGPSVVAKGIKKEAKPKLGAQSPPVPSAQNDPPTAAEITTLPQFARAGWSTIFLPTLYRSLGSSLQPFNKYNKDASIVPILQQILDIAFPGSSYRIKWGDKICVQATSRLSDKRSSIGRRANSLIDAYFRKEYSNDDVSGISTYARYATRHNGPALYGVPTPKAYVDESPDSPYYVAPRGFLESDFVISTLAPFIRSIQDSRGDFGKPIGALAMAAAAVERAFTRYHTGKSVDQGKFSRDNVFQLVDDYVANCIKFSDKKWAAILNLCNAKLSLMDNKPLATPSKLTINRRSLYVESSPPPEASDTPFESSDAPLEISDGPLDASDGPLDASDVEFDDN